MGQKVAEKPKIALLCGSSRCVDIMAVSPCQWPAVFFFRRRLQSLGQGRQLVALTDARGVQLVLREVVGVREVGVREFGVREVGAREIGDREVGAREVGAREVGPTEFKPPEIGSNEPCAAQIGTSDILSSFVEHRERSALANVALCAWRLSDDDPRPDDAVCWPLDDKVEQHNRDGYKDTAELDNPHCGQPTFGDHRLTQFHRLSPIRTRHLSMTTIGCLWQRGVGSVSEASDGGSKSG